MAVVSVTVAASSLAILKAFGSDDREFSLLELANIEALAETEKVPNISPYGDVIVGCHEKKYMECLVICNTLGCGQYYVANSVNEIAKQVKGRCKKCGGSSFHSF